MIVWIASYPRTGSKLIRSFLNQVFDLPNFLPRSYDRAPISEGMNGLIGCSFFQGSFEEFYLHARRSEKGFLIKTHYPPIDDSPAIVMVRDGRSALVSYYHFLNDRSQKKVTIPKLIRGELGIGTWSKTLEDWNPLKRPGTMLLRFEDILSSPDRVTDLLAEFLKLEPVRKWQNNFESLQKVAPVQFRRGNDRKNLEEFSRSDEALFWDHHREWMERLGYADPASEFHYELSSQPKNTPDRWLSYDETDGGSYQVPEAETLPDFPFLEGETTFRRLFEMERELADLRQRLTHPNDPLSARKKRSWILPWKRRAG